MTAQIVMQQAPGAPVTGSLDDGVIAVLVQLSNFDNTGVLAWAWEMLDQPIGSAAALSDPTIANPTFTPDVYGTYLIRLTTYTDAGATIVDDIDLQGFGAPFADAYDWRIPAAGETTEFSTARGWATAVEETLRDLHAYVVIPHSLDRAYDGGGAGLGRSITADAGAVVISNAVANATNTLELARTNAAGDAAALQIGLSAAAAAGVDSSRIRFVSQSSGGLRDVFVYAEADAGTDTYRLRITNEGNALMAALDSLGALTFPERTTPGNPGAGFGTFWVRSPDAPNVPMFTDDTGVDHVLAYSGIGAGTLDASYDFGGPGAGRAITADAGAVTISNAVADATNTLELSRTVGSGAALSIAGPTTTTGNITKTGDATFTLTSNKAAGGATAFLLTTNAINFGATDPILEINDTATLFQFFGTGNFTAQGVVTGTNGFNVGGTQVIGSSTAITVYAGSSIRAVAGTPALTLYSSTAAAGDDSTALRFQGTVVGPATRNIDILGEFDAGTDTYRLRINDNAGAQLAALHATGRFDVSTVLASYLYAGVGSAAAVTVGSAVGNGLFFPGSTTVAVSASGAEVGRFVIGGGLTLPERASPGGPGAGYGTFWVATGAPSTAYFTDDGGTDHQLAYATGAGAYTLQQAYDAGSVITTDATGRVEIIRGAGTIDGDYGLYLHDDNGNPGRTGPLFLIVDDNVGATGSTVRVLQSTGGHPALQLDSSLVGSTGSEIRISHIKAQVGSAGDAIATVSFYGPDDNIAFNQTHYADVRTVIHSPADTAESGRVELHVITAGTFGRALRIRGANAAAEQGVILQSDIAAGLGVAAFEFAAGNDFATLQPVFYIRDNANAAPAMLFSVDGVGAISVGSAGLVGSPAIVRTGDPDTGVYWSGDDELSIAVGGARGACFINGGGIVFPERASPGSPGAGFGTFWVATGAPSTPYFTDDGGTDHQLAYTTAYTTLQQAYDAGATIITDGTGRVEIERSAVGGLDADYGLYLHDDNDNPGRTAALFAIVDDNVSDGLYTSASIRAINSKSQHLLSVEYSALGADGPLIELFHSKNNSGNADDVVGTVAGFGRNTTGGTTRKQYAAIKFVIEDSAAGSEDGKLDIYCMRLDDSSRRAVEIKGRVDGVGETGVIFQSRMTTGSATTSVSAFTFRVTPDYLAGDAVFGIEDNAGTQLFRVEGDGTVHTPYGSASAPQYSTSASANSGLYFSSSTAGGISNNGVNVMTWESASPSVSITYLIIGARIQSSGDLILLADSGASATTSTISATGETLTRVTDVAASGPILDLYHNRATPGDGDTAGVLRFSAKNDAAAKITAAQYEVYVLDYNVATGIDTAVDFSLYYNGTFGVVQRSQSNLGEVSLTAYQTAANAATYAAFSYSPSTAYGSGQYIFSYYNNNYALDALKLDGAGVLTQTLTNTASATGPVLKFVHARTDNGAASDEAGTIEFWTDDGASATKKFAEIEAMVVVATAGAEYGALHLKVIDNSSLTTALRVIADGAAGGIISNAKAAAATPALRFRARSDYTAVQPFIYFESNDGTYNTHRFYGRGSFHMTSDEATSPGPILRMETTKSGAADDIIGDLQFMGEDASGNFQVYGDLKGAIEVATNGSEVGRMEFHFPFNGTVRRTLEIRPGYAQTEAGAVFYSRITPGNGIGFLFRNNGDYTAANSYQFAVEDNNGTFQFAIDQYGDIRAKGGFVHTLGPWMRSAITPGAATDMYYSANSATFLLGALPVAGSIVGISLLASANVENAYTNITVDVQLDGVTVFSLSVNPDGATRFWSTTQAKQTDAFSAGSRFGLRISGAGGSAAYDFVAHVLIESDSTD